MSMVDTITQDLKDIGDGLKSLEDVNLMDVLMVVLIAAVIIAAILLLFKLAGKLVKFVVLGGLLVVVGFLIFGFDPMGLGSFLVNFWNSLF